MAGTSKIIELKRLVRPIPPPHLIDSPIDQFMPAPDLEAWAWAAFIAEDAALVNEDHAHLRMASVGFLWTNVPNARRGRRVVGQAERGDPQGVMGKWARARAEAQVCGWFGHVPDFIITIDALFAAECGDIEFAALIEHELEHCGHEHDCFGAPKFNREGRPVWTMKAHDVEAFIGVARRYGAVEANVRELVDAVNRGPLIARAQIAGICGSCTREVA